MIICWTISPIGMSPLVLYGSYNVFFLLTVVDIDSFNERNTWSLDSQKHTRLHSIGGFLPVGRK